MRPLLKTHGGKYYLKDWIISHFPINYELLHYLEGFVGGGSIILNKKRSKRETICDLDWSKVWLYTIVSANPNLLLNILTKISYSEFNFINSVNFQMIVNPKNVSVNEMLAISANKYINSRMSRGGLGKNFAKSMRLRGGIPGDENAWKTSIENIPNISKRLQNVRIVGGSYKNLLEKNDDKSCFFYLDPPYLQETRNAKKAYGEFEMSKNQHEELLDLCIQSKSKILLSGYNSKLYNEKLSNWNKEEKSIVNHSSQKKKKELKVECLWKNY